MTIHLSTPALSVRFTPAAPGPLSTLRRLLGSVIAWFSLPISFILLSWVGISTASIGGSCASGGPYAIAVQCPESDAAQAAVAVILVFVAILGFALSSGFGVSLLAIGGFAVFGGFGALFIAGWVGQLLSSGLIVGGVFVLFALALLGVWLWAAPRSVVLGTMRVTGERYYSTEQAYDDILRIDPERAATLVKPRPIDWLLSIGVWLVAAGAGTAVALSWIGVL
jgi:hypothetical protein